MWLSVSWLRMPAWAVESDGVLIVDGSEDRLRLESGLNRREMRDLTDEAGVAAETGWSKSPGVIGSGFEVNALLMARFLFLMVGSGPGSSGTSSSSMIRLSFSGVLPRSVLPSDEKLLPAEGLRSIIGSSGFSGNGGGLSLFRLKIDLRDLMDSPRDFAVKGRSTIVLSCLAWSLAFPESRFFDTGRCKLGFFTAFGWLGSLIVRDGRESTEMVGMAGMLCEAVSTGTGPWERGREARRPGAGAEAGVQGGVGDGRLLVLP
jgi:hypothetical protein